MCLRFGLVMVSAMALAGCSIQTDEQAETVEEMGTFERKNIAPNPADNSQMARKPEHAFARTALSCIHKQYPNKISHVMSSAADAREPAQLTPVFYGCFDWHSAVHGHWLLTRLWGQNSVPDMDDEIAAALSVNFTDEKIAGEIAYFNGEDRASFERPYGIAWYLQLMAELKEIAKGDDAKAEQAKQWALKLQPLEAIIVARIKEWLPKLAYPIRLGTHNQTAFAFGLFHDWAETSGDVAMKKMVTDKALAFHMEDKNCPMAYEPSGEDFLSPCLMEADLMRRMMDQEEYSDWLTAFLPDIPVDGSADWLSLGIVNDPTDGKLVHLDGVNLSRAWALEGIASALPAEDKRRASLLAAAQVHGEAGEKSVSTPHYSGSHWLASFATYLRTKRGIKQQVAQTVPAASQPTPVEPAQ